MKFSFGKDPMYGTRDMVFWKMKSAKVITNSAKELCDVANRFVPSISKLFQKENDL